MNAWKWTLVVLPGGVLVAAVVIGTELFLSTKIPNDLDAGDLLTKKPQLDALRLPVVAGVIGAVSLHPLAAPDVKTIARALMLIAATENSFDGAVGDTDPTKAPGGPSISPWQIERVNALAYGWFKTADGDTAGSPTDRAAYAAVPTTGVNSYTWARRAAVFFIKECWASAGGDLRTALALWNGGPDHYGSTDAQSYAARGIGFADSLGWT